MTGVVILILTALMGRWAWRTIKRSTDPAAQSAVRDFESAVDDLKAALRRKGR